MGSGHDGTREYANSEEFEHIPIIKPSEEFDWRTKGAVTPVDYYGREISYVGESFSGIASSPESTPTGKVPV